MNHRRKLLAALGASVLGLSGRAFSQQPAPGMHRIGFLGPTGAAAQARRLDAFRAGLRELGYVEGKNLVIEYRWAEGRYERLAELAGELVRLKAELIVTHSSMGALAARQATTEIPIVFAVLGDAQAIGLVSSLARPGGNITGSTIFSPELLAKSLEILKEALPQVVRIGFLANPDVTPGARAASDQTMARTAKSLKVTLHKFHARGPEDFDGAFAAMAKQRIGAVTVQDEPAIAAGSRAIAILAARYRIPSIGMVEFAEAGGLIGSGVDFPALFHRAASYVDKILRGTKPGDLPVERASKFSLVVNQSTAKALGIRISQSILLRADRVIE
ncbi:MAG: ABC transporter substrate-binding protein [Betaproteobacteria bacterium]|nr:ABC transporter substrate-binding protein [Betaproteobacteria bacterium]